MLTQFCMLLLYALKINTGKFMITNLPTIKFCGLLLFPYSLTFTQGQITLETFFVSFLPNRFKCRPSLGATIAPNLGICGSGKKTSLEMVKNDIDLEGSSKQNIFFFSENIPKKPPPMSNKETRPVTDLTANVC